MKIFFLAALFLLSLSSCKLPAFGTNTGNPGISNSQPSPGYSSPEPKGVFQIAYQVCEKVSSCHGEATLENCFNQIVNLPGYTSELGNTAAAYPRIVDLFKAESDGLVTANKINFANCIDSIRELTCSDSLLEDAYSTLDPTNFAATNLLFRAASACSQIY